MPTKLGQNFLINKYIAWKIAEAANLAADDFVLEIGPGKGILTEGLAKRARKVVAVEIDGNLVEMLRNKFKDRKNVEIIKEDILKINLSQIVETPHWGVSTAVRYKLIANLPYYITSPVIRMFLEAGNPPSEMILMIQKEVAERITAKPGDMSILSVAVQYYAKPEILFYVSKENFDPIPEVDSAVIRISRITKPKEERIKTNDFFRVVRAGFCAKRKTLANNLANSFHLDKKIAEERLEKLGLNKKTRAQELSVENWKKLAELF